MEIIQPESVKGYSLDLVIGQAKDYARRIDPDTSTGQAFESIRIRMSTRLGRRQMEITSPADLNRLTTTNIDSLTRFLNGEAHTKLLEDYHESELYPYDCKYMSGKAVERLEDAEISALMYKCELNPQFQAGPKVKDHAIVLVLLELESVSSHWLIDYSADQHIGPNTLIANPFLSQSRKRLKRIIQENKTQSTPLVGPVEFFSDLYIF